MVLVGTSLHDPKTVLLVLLCVLAAVFIGVWLPHLPRAPRRGREAGTEPGLPSGLEIAVGAVTDFFDTLGIGSYATTTSLFKLFRLVPDRLIPGTLNVGHALPSVAQALIFIAIVEVDTWTLALMIGSSVLGAWFGAGVVSGWPRRRVQVGMGSALLVAAALMLRQLLQGALAGADNLSLAGLPLAIGVAGNFVLGAFMTLGIGLYAPCMILVSLLGLNARAAFPIMMGSCGFLTLVAGMRFVARNAYAPRAALGLTLGGTPAVLVAAFVVKALPLDAVRLLVIVVVVYTAVTMLRSATVVEAPPASEERDAPERAAGEA
jgi:uncharacterized membrane protein YfcA